VKGSGWGVENNRKREAKLGLALEIVKAPVVTLVIPLAVAQIPADRKPPTLREAAKQGQLSKVPDIAGVTILHGAPMTTTDPAWDICRRLMHLRASVAERSLEHFPEKYIPVFRQKMRPRKEK